MLSSRPLPQELVDKIIDGLGEDHRGSDHKKSPDDPIGVAREALHACALVSKNWTGRSRTHLFNEVEIRVSDPGLFSIPPETVMPYVTTLKMWPPRGDYFQPLLKGVSPLFHTAPIVCLEITLNLCGSREYLIEFISALSTTLKTVTLKSCSLFPLQIHDIVSAHPGLKRLYLLRCDIPYMGFNSLIVSRLSTPHSTDLEVAISTSCAGALTSAMGIVAQFPIRCRGLDFDCKSTPAMTRTANALIEANAASLSSLTAHIIVSTSSMPSQKRRSPLTLKLYSYGGPEAI